jgi:hypothetical protein
MLYIYKLENGWFGNHVVYSSTRKHSCPQCNELADTPSCKEPIRLVLVEAATARPRVDTDRRWGVKPITRGWSLIGPYFQFEFKTSRLNLKLVILTVLAQKT